MATAFLQGLPQDRKLWVKLPAEALEMLGAPPETRMLLRKPVYGQLDAPRRWYLEAVRRLKDIGLRQHCLDPCAFLMYEEDFAIGRQHPSTSGALGERRLCGVICLHVDDMLGSGNAQSATYQQISNQLKQEFNFREWQEKEDLEYCGASIKVTTDEITLDHQKYMHKVKPMTVEKGQSPEDEMDQKGITQLRGLVRSLQWPAVQSSPHLQCSVSMLSANVTKGLTKSAIDANKLLKFGKENSDVALKYGPIGAVEDLRLVMMFDASFCSRSDGSSQGGYILMLVHQQALGPRIMCGTGNPSSCEELRDLRWPRKLKRQERQWMLLRWLAATGSI